MLHRKVMFYINFGRYQGVSSERFFQVACGVKNILRVGTVTYNTQELRSYLTWCSKNQKKFARGHQVHQLLREYYKKVNGEYDDEEDFKSVTSQDSDKDNDDNEDNAVVKALHLQFGSLKITIQ